MLRGRESDRDGAGSGREVISRTGDIARQRRSITGSQVLRRAGGPAANRTRHGNGIFAGHRILHDALLEANASKRNRVRQPTRTSAHLGLDGVVMPLR